MSPLSLRFRLQLSIVALVGVIVVALSALYLVEIVKDTFKTARTIAEMNTEQIESYIDERARAAAAQRTPPPTTIAEVAAAYVEAVEQDAGLSPLLLRLMGNSPVIVESLITGPDGRILSASFSDKRGQRHNELPPLAEFERKSAAGKLADVFSANQDYEVVRELGVGQQPLLSIHTILSTVLLREAVKPRALPLLWTSGLALLASLAAAAVTSALAVRPFARLGELIDSIASGAPALPPAAGAAYAREVAAVESKLNLLGEQYRGARADARELRGNIDQLLARLEAAIFLFGHDDRLVMAGGSAARLVPGARGDLIGHSRAEIFPPGTELGALIEFAIAAGRAVKDRPTAYRAPGGETVRLLVTVEAGVDGAASGPAGTLVTLRESEPRRQIESQLDIAGRLAAISRLTSGAAHEIKNPLNSIALHAEVLKGRLEDAGLSTAEIDVISREITRLDRVVRAFLDFTRPIELESRPFDLAELVDELADLVRPDAERQGVEPAVEKAAGSAPVRGDRDLLKQAALNVVVNGIQAMSEGGRLTLSLSRDGAFWVLGVRDEGPGVPAELRERIFQLHFSTKPQGSGIGLAMSFRVLQLHGGTIEYADADGGGAEFRLRIPALGGAEGEA